MRVEALHDFLLELPRLRAQLLRVMGPDSCIETIRFLIGVMGTFGRLGITLTEMGRLILMGRVAKPLPAER